MTTIRLTEEEIQQLENSKFVDSNQEWKYIKPYYYKQKCGYYEIYSKEEFENEIK